MRRRANPYELTTESWLDSLLERLREETVTVDQCAFNDNKQALEFQGHLLHESAVWLVKGHLVRRSFDGVIVLSGLTIDAVRPQDAALTTRLLKTLPLRLLRQRVMEKLRDEIELNAWAEALGVGLSPPDESANLERAAGALGSLAPPRGRAGTSVEFYDELALEAVSLAVDGRPVLRGLVESRDRPERTVKGWIRTARDLERLDPRPRVWLLGPEHPARKES